MRRRDPDAERNHLLRVTEEAAKRGDRSTVDILVNSLGCAPVTLQAALSSKAQVRDETTPFAAAHRRRDPLVNMGLIQRQLAAAFVIRSTYEGAQVVLFSKPRAYENERVDTSLDARRFFHRHLAFAAVRGNTFRAWVSAHQDRINGEKVVDIVLAIVVDGEPIKDIEARIRCAKGRVSEAFRKALDDFAERMGG